MDQKKIISFLRQVMKNNNREWFQEHKKEYETAKAEFEQGVQQAIERITTFDPEIAHVQVKDCTYRFYRDTRFSTDKSPYKNHLGAYINAKGKKALRGGYYIHLEPNHCLLATGNYWLPTNILTACRNEMMANTSEWLKRVENDEFQKFYGSDVQSSTKEPTNIDSWDQPQGFGLTKLKTCPAGFPKDWEHVKYLRLKDYCCWHAVSDTFFESDNWLDEMEQMFRAAKPVMDFMNSVIDDYE
ncbi:MAG: DUF2461 domain-containing protein [Bacteroidaceae bacterium]|nr:DUF2461 domain-containing protein [Bacteroidaceae bacterium]